MSLTLLINEIYLSLQGESSFAGLPCVFIRTTGCDLRCSYCDSAYAFRGGRRMALAEVLDAVNGLAERYKGVAAVRRLPLVELTGGEPLIQPASLPLMTALCDLGYVVLLETSGAHEVGNVDGRVRRIVDLKGPSSGESARVFWPNLGRLKDSDEIKFVLGTVADYEWMKGVLAERNLAGICPVLVSWVTPLAPGQQDPSLKASPPGQEPISRRELAERIIADGLPVRFQLQQHKFIWPADQRGV
ncbi:MAG: radical SAM protein [Verrucomicrobia bacterium]|nr:radical SAM protein [Verrucomicrobiota bacterium]